MEKKEVIVYAENEMLEIKTYLESKNYFKSAVFQFGFGELFSGGITLGTAILMDTDRIENAVLFGITSAVTISLTSAHYLKNIKSLTDDERNKIKTSHEIYDRAEKELAKLQLEESEYLDRDYVMNTYPVVYELYQTAKIKRAEELANDLTNKDTVKIYAKTNNLIN